MRDLSVSKNVGPVLAVLLFSGSAAAQSSDYDPEYDNETAAGKTQPEVDGIAPADGDITAAESKGGVSSAAASASATAKDGEVASEADLSATDDADLNAFQAADGAVPADAVSSATSSNVLPWSWGAPRHLSSLTGSTGLFYAVEAGSDAAGTFGIGVHGAFFKYRDYLYYGDEDVYMWSGLNLRVTPIDYLEIFAGLEARANTSTFSDPELFQSLGDFNIGLKGYYAPIDLLTLGLLFGLEFKNPVGEVSVSFDGMTYPLGFLATADFSKLNKKVPIRAHLNTIYRFDNSANLVADVEKERGGCGTDRNNDGVPEYSGCLDPVERKALEIDRTDQFRIALGVDAAFPFVTPLVEYAIDIPVNRQKFECPIYARSTNPDSCMDEEGFVGMRQFLTVGVRILPPVKTLSVDLGVEIGLAGYAPSVQELAPQSPYRVLFGLTYNFEPFAKKPAEAVALVPRPPLPTSETILPQPVISGYVHDAADANEPLKGATVTYLGIDLNPQLSDQKGRFDSYAMPTGKVTIAVSAEGYEDATFTVDIPDPVAASKSAEGEPLAEGESVPLTVSLDCPMSQRKDLGHLNIRVEGKDGPLSGAAVEITGPMTSSGVTDAHGEYRLDGESGKYIVMVKKSRYFDRERTVDIAVNQEAELKIMLTEVPAEPSVEVSRELISIKKRVLFKVNSEEIETESLYLLDEVVDVLKQHSEIQKVEIQGHTDNRGKNAVNLALSGRRAEAVKAYLVSEGIRAERLTAKGYGAMRPRAPNVTASGRTKNRRVEFHILERAE